jgi:hypothetical protein
MMMGGMAVGGLGSERSCAFRKCRGFELEIKSTVLVVSLDI